MHRFGIFVALTLVAAAASCGTGNSDGPSGDDGGAGDDGSSSGGEGGGGVSCMSCTTGSDCSGGAYCAVLSGEHYCFAACAGNSCPSDQTCTTALTTTGASQNVCVPRGGVCSTSSKRRGQDGQLLGLRLQLGLRLELGQRHGYPGRRRRHGVSPLLRGRRGHAAAERGRPLGLPHRDHHEDLPGHRGPRPAPALRGVDRATTSSRRPARTARRRSRSTST